MPLAESESIQYQVVYWAIVFLVAIFGAAWKAVGMRGRVTEAWSERVKILVTGLNEGATRELKTLRSRIDEQLGSEGDVYKWMTADPSALLSCAKKYVKLNRVSRLAPRYLEWLMRIESFAILALFFLFLGVVVTVLNLANITHHQHQIFIGLVTIAFGLFVGLFCFILYWVLERKLSGAEILAKSVVE